MVDAALERVGMADLSQAPDRRTLRRPEEARLPRPRAGAGRPGHPARRALHRRRRQDRGSDHRAAAGPARRGPRHAGLDPQSRLACPNSATAPCSSTAPCSPPARPRRSSPTTICKRPSAACCAISCSAGSDLHDDDDARSVTVLTDDERPFVLYGDKAQTTSDAPEPTDE